MIRYAFDLYPADDPKDGTRLVRFSHLQEASYRGEGNGTGSGRIALRGTSPDAFFIDPAGLQYVRVVEIDDADAETVRGGFFLEEGDFAALTADENELLTFGGTGVLAYVQREVMWSHTYEPWGRDPFDKQWRLYNQSTVYAGGNYLGAILWRIFDEGLKSGVGPDGGPYDDDKPESAIPAITLTFDGFEDTDGTPWSIPGGEFKAQVGESLLDVTARLMQAGLYVELDPDTFELRAWETEAHRRDRTGTAWGASVVRFQAPSDGTIATGNIKDDLSRTIRANIRRTAILAGGDEDLWALAEAASGIPWHGAVPLNVNDVDAAQAVADNQLIARSDAGDNIALRIKLGDDPTEGRYVPWDHVQPLDTVTVHTGTGQWDANEAAYPVAAVTVKLRKGGDWDAYVELGATFSSLLEPSFQVAPPAAHSHVFPFCTVDLPGDDEIYEHWTWEGGFTGGHTDWTNEYLIEPIVHPHLGIPNQAPYAAAANGVQSGPPGGAALGTTYRHSVNNDTGGTVIAWVPGLAGTWDMWVRNPFASTYFTLHYVDDSGTPVSGGTLTDFLSTATVDAWVQLTAAIPAAPAGTSGIGIVGRTAAGGAGLAATYWIDEVTISLSGTLAGPGTDEYTGSSQQIARCDHNHAVEALLTGEDDTGLVLAPNGSGGVEWVPGGGSGASAVIDHGTLGASETFDVADGHDHEGIQDAALTIALAGAVAGEAAWLTLRITQDSGGGNGVTLPAEVLNAADVEAAWNTDPDAINTLTLYSYDGGASWLAFLAGGAAAPTSGRWELAVVPGSPPDALYADGDYLYIFVP